MNSVTDIELRKRLRSVLQQGWYNIPSTPGYGGTGAPGKILEESLGINGGNLDTPDAGRWEIKFHSRSSLLTLFHLESQPKGHIKYMVKTFGWPDDKGRVSFRHTIHKGHSSLGFVIANKGRKIIVRNPNSPNMECPYWTHDSLINAFVSKFRRLIVVKGQRKDNRVFYDCAHMYWEPKTTKFIKAISQGIIAIDFDARTENGHDGLRNHGTKFRIKYDDLNQLYNNRKKIA